MTFHIVGVTAKSNEPASRFVTDPLLKVPA